MAKKKSDQVENIGKNIVISKLEKNYGSIFLDPEEIASKQRTIFPLSPKLDIALSGGVPSGSWGIISGMEKLGKSNLALSICSKAQKPEFGSRKCYYHDVECRIEAKNLKGVSGLELSQDKMQIIRSTRDNVLTAETHLTIAEALLKSEPGIVLVIDSSSALCTNKEYDGEIAAAGRNDGPKLLAQFTRKLSNIVAPQDSLVIIIQHMIANTSGYGVPWMEDGGSKIKYQADFKLRGVSYKKWEDSNNDQIGQVNNWHVVYSSLGQPGAKVESYLRYGYGIDEIMEVVDLACDVGLIEKGGAWFELSFLESPEKLQGQKKVCDYLRNDNKSLEILKEKIKEFYNVSHYKTDD